jgi:hypoxanthine phosphoribosyltransferase
MRDKQVLFTELELQNKVGELAYNIKKQKHDFPPVFICVLNGAFMFFTDLVKRMDECEIDFIRAKSYEGITQNTVKITKSIEIDISRKDVYLVDDIYDTGETMKELTNHLKLYNPRSITPVTLFKRWNAKHPDLIYGFELYDEAWLVGYGLDNEKGLQRNLKHILGIPRED